MLVLLFLVLLGAFFRTQVLRNSEYALKSESNRLREVPLPAPRGIIYDRNDQIIAENVPGYSVKLLASSTDSLLAVLGHRQLVDVRDRPHPQAQQAVLGRPHQPHRPPTGGQRENQRLGHESGRGKVLHKGQLSNDCSAE